MKQTKYTQKNLPSKLIWDLPLRIFHWLIAILILGSWYSVEITYDMTNHMRIGYALLALVLFRMTWGVIGTNYSQFKNCIFSPKETFQYMKSFFHKESPKYAGHNPMGAIAIFTMLMLLITQVTTGLFASDEFYVFAPFSLWVSEETSFKLTGIHRQSFDVLLGVIALHIVVVFYYLIFKKQNLIKAMLTGRKILLPIDKEGIPNNRIALSITLIIICSLLVYALISYSQS